MSYENKGPSKAGYTNVNRDAITGVPGAHPIGTDLGAVGGVAVGAAADSASARSATSLAPQ